MNILTKWLTISGIVAFSAMLAGCGQQNPKSILSGHSFYYAEACEPESVYYEDLFSDNGFIEIEHKEGEQTRAPMVPVLYEKDSIVVSDGKIKFPCLVSGDRQKVTIECKHREEREPQIMYGNVKDAIANRPFCTQDLRAP